MLGTKLASRYRILKHLGEGGFGQAFLAEDEHLPEQYQCVVKKFHMGGQAEDATLRTAKRLFDSEAKVLHQLGHHPQIPQLLAHFEDEGEFFLVEEYVEGHSLAEELIPGQPQTEAAVLNILQDLLGILSFVHRQQVIHRDIKPSNVIRRSLDQRLVLIDFGAVKQMSNTMIATTTAKPHTVVIGTPGYMPSEQFRGNPKRSSDIYAVGMMAIQALTGLSPSTGELREDEDTGEIQWRDRAQVSPALADILSKMVLYDFRYRYASADDVLADLAAIMTPTVVSAANASVPSTVVGNGETVQQSNQPTAQQLGAEPVPETLVRPLLPQNSQGSGLEVTQVAAAGNGVVDATELPGHSTVVQPPPAQAIPDRNPNRPVTGPTQVVPITPAEGLGISTPLQTPLQTPDQTPIQVPVQAKSQPKGKGLRWAIAGGASLVLGVGFVGLAGPHLQPVCAVLNNCTALVKTRTTYNLAIADADAVANVAKEAKTLAELQTGEQQLSTAVKDLQSIANSGPEAIAVEAKRVLPGYESTLKTLSGKVALETKAKESLDTAVAKGDKVAKEKDKAKTVDALEANRKILTEAVALLDKVPKESFVTATATTKKKEYQGQVKELDQKIDTLLATSRPKPGPTNIVTPPPPVNDPPPETTYYNPPEQSAAVDYNPEPVYTPPEQDPYYEPEPVPASEPYYEPEPAPEPAPAQEPLWGGPSDPQPEPLW
jgi:serine/threonine protein kinase